MYTSLLSDKTSFSILSSGKLYKSLPYSSFWLSNAVICCLKSSNSFTEWCGRGHGGHRQSYGQNCEADPEPGEYFRPDERGVQPLRTDGDQARYQPVRLL